MSVQERTDLLEKARRETEDGASFTGTVAQELEGLASEVARELYGSRSGEEAAQALMDAAQDMRSITATLTEAAEGMGAYIKNLQQ